MELTKTITVSLSIKVQHEGIGGLKYESSDLFECESETVPSSYDESECAEVHKTLRDRVEKRIADRKAVLIESLNPKNSPPFP